MQPKRINYLVLFFAVLGYSFIILNQLSPEILSGKTVCLFKNITGIPCPACGTTRSATYIVSGHLKKALLTNPLGYLAILLLLTLPPLVIADLLQKKQRFIDLYHKTETIIRKPVVAIFLIILITANWIWNIIKEL